MAPKTKYTLYKAEAGEGPAPCAFFSSPKGCNNGANCKFAHILPDAPVAAAPAVTWQAGSLVPAASGNNSVSSSDISSESEDEAPPAPAPVPVAVPTVKAPKVKKPKAPKVTTTPQKTEAISADSMFAAPGQKPQTPASQNKRKRSTDQSDPFSKPKHAPKVNALPQAAPAATTPKSQKKKTKVLEKQSSFRDLVLPVASFSVPVPGVKNMIANLPIAPPTPSAPPQPPKFPIPASSPEGIKWQKAVIASRQNPKYNSEFDFDKIRMQEAESKETGAFAQWIKAKPYGSWCANNPHAIAIDCEMCETKCPVTGISNHKALCRLSVVNAVNPDDVLLDTLVKPEWPVVDHRSRINGIKKDHLESVQFTLEHAQAFMMALCSNETVIIGHAVHNDLIALQMEHHCNADSAMLFSVKDEQNATCSLKDLAMGVLKREMPDVHDSVNDARVALFVLEEGYLKTNGKTVPIVRSFSKKKGGSDELFVHRIPKGCYPEHISNMFLAHTHIKPKEVQTIDFNSDTGKTTVTFLTVEHAHTVFKTLEGEAKPDKTGRLQKRVYLKTGGYIHVRQMTAPRKRKEVGNA